MAYPTGNPPYGLTYTSPEFPIMETPFIDLYQGHYTSSSSPVRVPLYNVSPTNPDNGVDPISGAGSVYYKNKTGYAMQYNLSIDRQIGANTLLSIGYIGSLGRHLLTVHSANPGNPALCLSLSQPSEVAPGSPTCGPFEDNLLFTRKDGTVVNGTREPFPNQIGTDAYYENMGNSKYNALEVTFKRLTSGWALSGISRFASGLPVTFASSGDNYLVQVQNNGVNVTSIDMPNYDGTGYKLNQSAPRQAALQYHCFHAECSGYARQLQTTHVLLSRHRQLRYGTSQGNAVFGRAFS